MRSEVVRARVSAQEMNAYIEVSGREPMSAWVRRMLNEAVGRSGVVIAEAPVEKKKPPPEVPVEDVNAALEALVASGPEPDPPSPPVRCPQWRNHRAGRFCKHCGETMPV